VIQLNELCRRVDVSPGEDEKNGTDDDFDDEEEGNGQREQ
jgi:hypothetical protein